MFRIITNAESPYMLLAKLNFKNYARIYLYSIEFGADDIKLDKLLVDEHKIDLRTACVGLINAAKLSTASNNELVLYWSRRDFDELARLITYGNGKILGSKILNNAIEWAKEKVIYGN